MWLNRGFVTSLFVALPLLAGTAVAGEGQQSMPSQTAQATVQSLESLRETCVERGRQGAPIDQALNCGGSYTYWVEQPSTVKLNNDANILATALTKNNRFSTSERTLVSPAEPSVIQCSRWQQMRMSAPEGMGITVTISRCEDFNPVTVAQLCKDAVQDFCSDQYRQVACDKKSDSNCQAQQGSLCTLSPVKIFDGCALNTNEVTQQEPVQAKALGAQQEFR